MPRPKRYGVTLTKDQRAFLLDLVKKGQAKARMITRARLLLLSEEGHPDGFIAQAGGRVPQGQEPRIAGTVRSC